MFTTSPDKAETRAGVSVSPAGLGPERAVLTHLLDQHPRRLTLHELSHEVRDRVEDDVVERAVGNLAAAAFLIHEGADLVPAPAVISFDQARPLTHF